RSGATVALRAEALSRNETERDALKSAAGLPDAGGEQAGAPRTSKAAVPRQLPPDVAAFTGRELALEWLHARLRSGRERGSTAVVITAAVGKAGVGKTTLAVHAGHQLRSLFPDGQLYVNLRGVEAHALDPF